MTWSTSCKDWQTRLMAGESIIPPPLFPQEAESALSIFKELRLVDVLGRPTYGEVGRPWVFDFVASIFGSYDNETGRRLISEYFLLISKKNSKALALDTPIPTPDGWKAIGEIHAGDAVFGTDGKPCAVLGESEIFTDHDCYRLEFSNGEIVVADAGHLWTTSALADRPGKGPGNNHIARRIRTRTTREIAETLFRPGDGARNHSMPMPQPIDLPEMQLPIPPYTLGAWLGDGHSKSARITCADEEIMQNIMADGFLLGSRYQKESKAWTQSIGITDKKTCKRGHDPLRIRMRYDSKRGKSYPACYECDRERDHSRRNGTHLSPTNRFSLHEILREQGLLNNKHIPEQYFRSSISQRLALLQGLMDTDGTINKNGRVLAFSGINERLVRGVSELLSTFGIKSTVIERQVECNGVPAGTAFFVQFMAFRDEVPAFRLKRKLDRMRLGSERKNSRSKSVQIISVEKVDSTPVKCITVDAPDHQFLFGKTILPTHNSSTAAGVMLSALIRNWRDSAEFLILAPTVEIANNSFYPARDMIKADEELSDLFLVQEHYRQITHRNTGAVLKVVAAANETVGGKKATGILIDEAWLFGKIPNAENMLREACGGLASRPEGFVIWLTTQSDEAPAGVFKQKLDYARGVRDGRIDDNTFLPILYENPESILKDKAYMDPKYWYLTNPNLGASVDEAFISREFKKAEEAGDASMQGFLSKHLNIEMGLSLKSQRWAGADFWEAAAGDVTLETILTQSDVIEIGIDGGGLDDLLGLSVLGRHAETGDWLLFTRAWCNPIAIDRRKSEASKYRDFEKDGDLVIVAEIGQDIKDAGDIVRRCEISGLLDRIGVDQAGIGAIVDELEAGDENGANAIEHDRIVGIPQGWRLNGAIKTLERKVAEKTIIVPTSAMMLWCVGNARVEPRGNAISITKQASGTGKIDPLMATFSAVALMAMNPEAKMQRSIYEGMSEEAIIERMTV